MPRREPRLAHLQLVPLSADRILAVLVGTDGAVENRVMPLPPGVTPSMLEQTSNYISSHLAGRTLPEAVRAIRAEIASGHTALDAASHDLVERGLAESRAAGESPWRWALSAVAFEDGGRLGEATAFVQHNGSGVNPQRQEAPSARTW